MPPQRQLDIQDYIQIVRRHWALIAIFTIVGGPLAYGVSRILPARYKSQTVVLVDQPTVPTDYVKPVVSLDLSQRLASMQQQILSRTRLEPIIREFGLYPKDLNRLPIDDLVERLQKAVQIDPIAPMAETDTHNLPGFTITVTLDRAKTAQQVCTALTSMFIEENLRLRQQHSEETTQFLSQQLNDAKAKLDQQDAKLAAFKDRYLGSLPDEEQTNLNLLATMNSQLDAIGETLNRAQQDKSFAESLLAQQVATWQSAQVGHDPGVLESQLAGLQTQLATLRAKYTDEYPDVVRTKRDIAELQQRIAAEATGGKVDAARPPGTAEPSQITQLRAQIHSYEQIIAEKMKEQQDIQQQIKVYESRVQSTPGVEQQYKEITRDYQTALDFYNDLLKKSDESTMATNLERDQEGEQFRVLDPPNLPDKPSFPNRPLFTLGGFGGGLGLGLALALFVEMQNSSIRTEQDVELLLNLPVLAMISEVVEASGGSK